MVGAGPAHVPAYRVLVPLLPTDVLGHDGVGRRPGEHHPDGAVRGLGRAEDAAAGVHHVEQYPHATLFDTLVEAGEVILNGRLDGLVEHGHYRAVILANLGVDVRGERVGERIL